MDQSGPICISVPVHHDIIPLLFSIVVACGLSYKYGTMPGVAFVKGLI